MRPVDLEDLSQTVDTLGQYCKRAADAARARLQKGPSADFDIDVAARANTQQGVRCLAAISC